MSASTNAAGAILFKPRTSKWFAGTAWTVAAIGLISALITDGVEGLLTGWPLLALAFFGWWIFWYPSVCIGTDEVTLINPLRSITIPWQALIAVDTKFALALITPRGCFTSWAAPAPGIWGTHRGKPEHVRNLPGSTYGPAQSIRPGDLVNTDSGTAAYLVRRRWAELAESGQLATGTTDLTQVTTEVHWAAIACGTLLVAASVLAMVLV